MKMLKPLVIAAVTVSLTAPAYANYNNTSSNNRYYYANCQASEHSACTYDPYDRYELEYNWSARGKKFQRASDNNYTHYTYGQYDDRYNHVDNR